MTTETYARLLCLAQLGGAFRELGREAATREAAPDACRALWEFVEAELERLRGS